MKRNLIYPVIILLLTVIFSLGYCQQQRYTRKILSENQRLWNENRDLRKSLQQSGAVDQQIASHQAVQQRTAGQFIERRAYYRRNWQQFIAVSADDYKTGFLGGIKNLHIQIKNQTEYPIDNVVVTVTYLRNNNEVFKTEQYTISNIAEKSQRSIAASNSRKGSKVSVKIQSITSQAMNFCYSVSKPAPAGNPDPYECVPSTGSAN
ncbi:hypothetical protein J2T02_005291 [Chitinophaga terrae (ex Kim and Jung 2007)]|uniref:hypothetical protein n=1 Tax=Chitinophaga terrae (ex Kim and Jung 2007) TaxID=408074 RepID=UPI0027836F2D|nr:hypothetical protein [Chitinophaga terrae (ex Kim and Jung 2007)]MDQ0110142.1 hypothetical protein [Chitinophaga terrae (ex Kim and Jung 2007)]